MANNETVSKMNEVENIETCQRCENSYIIIKLKEGEDYNEFYFRYCPFCGLCTDQITGSVEI